MKIFIIEQNENTGYDCYFAYIIAADFKPTVRRLAADHPGDEGKEVWQKAKITKIGIYTGRKKRPHIILSDFRAG